MRLTAFIAAVSAATFLAGTACAAESGKFLADRHAAGGVKCESCHKAGPKEAPKKEDCLACHGGSYKALAEKTDKGDINYHATHVGEPECTQCHQGHKPPRLLCDQCHEFQVKVP